MGGKRILIADDNKQIRMLVSATLRAGGYELLEAADGAEALDMAVAEQPDLVLLDVMMPDLDGFEVLHFLRKRQECAGCKVVMLTTAASATDLQRGAHEGADGYVVKPFMPADLKSVVANVLDAE
jgi:CheY-like chemotaxis protein